MMIPRLEPSKCYTYLLDPFTPVLAKSDIQPSGGSGGGGEGVPPPGGFPFIEDDAHPTITMILIPD